MRDSGSICPVSGSHADDRLDMRPHTHTVLYGIQQVHTVDCVLLLFIGGKMLKEGIGNSGEETTKTRLGIAALLVQGIATSIDALSVGFTIAEYGFMMAFVCAFLISVVTFVICMAGLVIGKKFGTALSGRAAVLGGIILIAIGVEIFISGVF